MYIFLFVVFIVQVLTNLLIYLFDYFFIHLLIKSLYGGFFKYFFLIILNNTSFCLVGTLDILYIRIRIFTDLHSLIFYRLVFNHICFDVFLKMNYFLFKLYKTHLDVYLGYLWSGITQKENKMRLLFQRIIQVSFKSEENLSSVAKVEKSFCFKVFLSRNNTLLPSKKIVISGNELFSSSDAKLTRLN